MAALKTLTLASTSPRSGSSASRSAPASPSSPQPMSPSGTYPVTRTRGIVLVIDPDEAVRNAMIEALGNDYRVYGVEGAAELAEVLEWIEPRVIMCAAKLPHDVDGFALVKALARNRPPGRCAFVMLTRERNASDAIRAIQCGARSVECPVDVAKMRAVVDKCAASVVAPTR